MKTFLQGSPLKQNFVISFVISLSFNWKRKTNRISNYF